MQGEEKRTQIRPVRLTYTCKSQSTKFFGTFLIETKASLLQI